MGSNKQGSRAFSNANDDTKNLTPKSDYYIDPSETRESFKSPLVLSGSKNYPKWYRAMVRGFTLKKKLGFADGTIAVPAKDHHMYGAWKQCNELVLSWILKAVSPEIAKSVGKMANAVDVWRNLKERFSPGDQSMISDILEEIYSLRQGERDVGSYFDEFGVLWNELELLRPLPVCTCVATKCSCGAMQRVKEQREQEKVGRFLKGLDDQRFVAIRSRIMRENPLPPIGEVYISVSQLEETQRPDLKQLQSQPLSTSKQASSKTQPGKEVKGIDEILVHSSHPCPLTLKPAGESYTCSGCKQLGFGPSYRCESSECNDKCGVYVLHEYCVNAVVHSPVRHPFFKKSNFLFLMEPPSSNRICDACTKDVEGFEYHCFDTGKDLHPCCLKLKDSISDREGNVTLKLSKKTIPTKCKKCKSRKVDKNNAKGWSYVSSNGEHCYHVSCFKELIHEEYEKGYFFKENLPMVTYDDPKTQLEAPGNKEMVKVRGSSSGSGTIKMVCKIASVVFKLIFSAIFGDPVSLVLGLLEALVPAMG